MTVYTQHPDYIKAAPRYKLIRDIINNDAMCHIRSPEPDNPTSARNIQYKQDAVLTNFTNLTSEGLTGLIFRKKLKLSVPNGLNYILEDTTGTGINIYQFSQHATQETIQVGRYGLLTDYYEQGQKAYIKPYCAENIINWKTRYVNGRVLLSLLVLCEYSIVDTDDIFSQTCAKEYRVLALDENNLYVQHLYNYKGDYQETYEIYDYYGQRLDYIPFVFIGSQNNDWEVDKQPLYDLAILNKSHYQNSADQEESVWINGQPYLVVDPGEMSQEDFMATNPGGIAYGSRKVLITGPGGKPVLIQASPNTLVASVMESKLIQAAKIGARLIEPSGGRETAEAARIRYSSQASVLYTLANNVEWAVTKALKSLCQFMGEDPNKIKYTLNKDFYDDAADPLILAQQMIGLENGVVSREEIRAYEEKTGVLDIEEPIS